MPCCHDNHNTVIELAMQRRAAFSWAGQKAMRSLRSRSLRSRDALHLSSNYTCALSVPTNIYYYIADMCAKGVGECTVTFQPSADSFGIHRLGFKCSWWLPRQANDAVAYELSIFSENHDYESFSVLR